MSVNSPEVRDRELGTRVSRFERPFAARVLRLARSGTVQANAKVLRERGPLATIYFGAMVLLGMVVGGVGFLAVVAIIVTAFAGSGNAYGLVSAVALILFALPTLAFVTRMVQFLSASKRHRQESD